MNCAGGPTPWGTWLSCEEHDAGLVWECDPTGAAPARRAPGAGHVQARGGLRRPARRAAVPHRGQARRALLPLHARPTTRTCSAGLLEVATVDGDGAVTLGARARARTSAAPTPTRKQVAGATRVQRRRGHLVRQRRRVLHDQGRQEGVGLRHRRRDARGRSTTTARPATAAAAGRRQRLRRAAPATSSSARTATTSRSASSRPTARSRRSCGSTRRARAASRGSGNETVGVDVRPVGHAHVLRRASATNGTRRRCYEVTGPFRARAGAPAGHRRRLGAGGRRRGRA